MTAGGFADRLLPRLDAVSISLTVEEIRLLGEYWSVLAHWNTRVNLTALPLEAYPAPSIDRLIVEPLVAVRLMPPVPMTWFDLGSGGGSPAIPIKIVAPQAGLRMVESRSRKAAFLREAVRSLGLAGVSVLSDRFENVASQQPGAADCITVRAVRSDVSMLTTCRRLLKTSGRLLLFEGPGPVRDLGDFVQIDEVAVDQLRTCVRVLVPRGTND